MSLSSSLMKERLKEHFFLLSPLFVTAGRSCGPQMIWNCLLCQNVWGTLHSLSSATTTCTSHYTEPNPHCHGVIQVPLQLQNCLSPSPHIKRVCHLKPEFTLTQLCRCDHPVYCLYKCLVIYLTSVPQLWCMCCSRGPFFQGFCWTLFRVMWKRVALSLCFFSLTYGSVPYYLMICSQYIHYYLILKCRMAKKSTVKTAHCGMLKEFKQQPSSQCNVSSLRYTPAF